MVINVLTKNVLTNAKNVLTKSVHVLVVTNSRAQYVPRLPCWLFSLPSSWRVPEVSKVRVMRKWRGCSYPRCYQHSDFLCVPSPVLVPVPPGLSCFSCCSGVGEALRTCWRIAPCSCFSTTRISTVKPINSNWVIVKLQARANRRIVLKNVPVVWTW